MPNSSRYWPALEPVPIITYFGAGSAPRRQDIRPRVTKQHQFVEKELRQIIHFLHREMGKEYYIEVEGGCSCGVCPDISQYVLAEAALSDSKVYKKFKEMAHKYDLHITIQRDTGRIWATKKGIESGKVPSVEKGR